ncbi:hypothetical protein HMI55_006212 [Coelomomyces lativittatus]|nr:hypothetical protein HMI55_006212 [Coelomomyces lativittatus]
MTNGSDSENAMFSGSKTSVLEQIEESFFFVLYVMHEKTKGSNVHPNFIAMILEMLVTFIHLGGYILSSQVNL